MSETIKVINYNGFMYNLGSDTDAVAFFRALFKAEPTATGASFLISEVPYDTYEVAKYTN